MNDNGTMGGMPPSAPMPMNDDGSMGMDDMMPMMQMTFYWGKDASILFYGWPGNSTGMYILALLFVFFLALIVEALTHHNLTPTKSNHIMRTVLHTLRVVFSYSVMLAVMSFNVGVLLVAVLGHAIGFFLFRVLKKACEKDLDMPPMAC
ncbi:copper transporter 1-like [Cynara cardunculus var. scolymus]|uniref:copper transporter 1-like n=1 Tax=Cynara cardunculus var. scolymus TaxID=59895 RepID=UPI000D62AB77|nr:copper transporter 1-like [Cynara cardunculus var. scolymus]